MTTCGSLEWTRQRAEEEEADKALSALQILPDAPWREALIGLASRCSAIVNAVLLSRVLRRDIPWIPVNSRCLISPVFTYSSSFPRHILNIAATCRTFRTFLAKRYSIERRRVVKTVSD